MPILDMIFNRPWSKARTKLARAFSGSIVVGRPWRPSRTMSSTESKVR